MSAEITTPSCEVTGLPLPILPNEPAPSAAHFDLKPNWHHHFHPERDWTLQTMAGLAVRGARVQYVNFTLHTHYHRIFTGPELPADDNEAFRAAVLGAAGVIPRQAIDVSRNGDYSIVTTTDRQHDHLSKPHITKIDKPGNLAKFFADYAARQNLSGVIDTYSIEEFLDETTGKRRRRELASGMLAEALGLSLESINPEYKSLRREGYLRSEKPETFRKVAKRLIRRHSLDYFSELAQRQLIPSA